MKVAIRADASLEIGTGHVMRCMTLAEELKQKGVEVLFICRNMPGNLIEYISKSGFAVEALNSVETTNVLNMASELATHSNFLATTQEIDADETYKILEKDSVWDWLIVDHYSISDIWEIKLKNIVNKILVIDDLADRIHCCNVLLDQNYYIDMNERYKTLLPVNCKLLLGPEYSLLRKDFREQRECLNKRNSDIDNIFVFFGGVDLSNMTERVLKALIDLVPGKFIVNAVIGSTNPHRKKLQVLCDGDVNINLHIQVKDMAKMMAEADLSVGSGGTVTWERCCVGLPTIAWPVADNQKKLLKDSAEAGLVYLIDGEEPTVDEIATHIRALLQNSSLCESMRNKGLKTIDGRGAIRVANLMCPPTISVNIATVDDVQKVFDWRNEDEVRRYSHNIDEIKFSQHEQWFKNVIEDPNRYILIGSISNFEVGVVRFDVLEKTAEISIYLIKGMHGKGYGSALVAAGEIWLKDNCLGVEFIVAEVLPENITSIKLFENSGYELNNIKYRKSISNV